MRREPKGGIQVDGAFSAAQWQDCTSGDLIAFFSALDEVFFTVDILNSRLMQISTACEKLFGYTQAEFMADPLFWTTLIHPDDRYIIEEEGEILRRGERVRNEYRIIRKDKTIRWVENKIVPTLDEYGTLIRIDGVTRDITRRRQAEDVLHQSEERFRRIVETAQEGIWTLDENDKTDFVNQKMADILGYAPQEMIGMSLYDFMDEGERSGARERLDRRRRGIEENIDTRYRTKTGEFVWANISASSIVDAEGTYKGALAMVTDVTRRRLNEEALKISEANLRTILNNTNTAYVLFTTDMKIISFNAIAQTFSLELNHKRLEINTSIKDYFSEDRWPFVQATLDKVATGDPIVYEISYAKPDGTAKWHEIRWVNIKDSMGKTWGFILANTDITREKLAALEREKITTDLIQHNKDLEQFTYIISHNLRAPVANIMALTAMLNDADLDVDTKQEITNRVSQSIENLDMVIKDLNHILQAREQVNEQKETIYFRELMDTIRNSIYSIIVSENVDFQYNFEEVESIFSTRSYLYSIFYNLASNSIKYRTPGVAPVISIKSHKLKNKVELYFRDNGKGIDLDKHRSHLFGLYKRFDTTMEGKGMGLFMVKTQVEALGGTIRIKSRPGDGTEFVIQLPI
jgi:PAS domain S-box-containing protein